MQLTKSAERQSSRDEEKQDHAAPVHNGFTLPGAASTGDATASPSPISKNRSDKGVSVTNGNPRLEALLERQKQLDALLVAEKLRLAKRKQKDDRKLFAIVGRSVCQAAEQSPEFHLMLRQTLAGLGGVLTEGEQKFLGAHGWELS
jgi:hypothetical protein